MTAELETVDTPDDGIDSQRDLVVRVWGPTATRAQSVIDDGYEVWVGVDDGSGLGLRGTQGFAVVFNGIDDQHRIAGIGYAAAENFTIPFTHAAVAAAADTALDYFETLTSP